MTPPRVVGRYEILRLLGSGGMASVHLARQPALDREVALKELHSIHATDASLANRFLHESRVAGALNHPSIVGAIEYFEHDGVPFIAMEYLERGSLRPLVGRLSLAEIAGVLESVLDGLAEAAARGIVHRDLKPENVLITADGRAKVADFGIAKAIGQVWETDFRTATGQIIGTPAYMAPEQAAGGEITPQADLYATGLIAYELLAGRHPYHDVDAPMALLMRHVNGMPPPLAALRPDLPPAIVEWVDAMLAKDPAARPPGAAAACDRLEGAVCDALGARWRRAAPLPEPAAAPAPATAVETPPPTEMSFVSVVPRPAEPTAPLARVSPANTEPTAPLAPVYTEPTAPLAPVSPVNTEPTVPLAPVVRQPAEPAVRRRSRWTAVLVLAGAPLVLVVAIALLTATRGEPRAAEPSPAAAPVVEQRARDTPKRAKRAVGPARSATPTPTSTRTPAPTPEPEPASAVAPPPPAATPTPTPSPTATPTPTPSPTPTPTPTATPDETAEHAPPPPRPRRARLRRHLQNLHLESRSSVP